MWLLHWRRLQRKIANAVVLPGKREWCSCKHSFDDLNRFLQPPNTDAGRIERNTALLIIRAVKSRAEPKNQTPIREDIDRSGFASKHNWMAKIVCEDIAPNPQRGGGRCGRHHTRDWWERHEVVGHKEAVIAERFHLLCFGDPRFSTLCPVDVHTETKWMLSHRSSPSY